MTHLQVFRKERHPLVALTALAFVMRLCLLVLASALTPDAAAAAGLTSLCQPSGQEQNAPASHDPLTCQCGPVCAHGCALQACLAGSAPVLTLVEPASGPARTFAAQGVLHPLSRRAKAIRDPPFSLI